MDKKITRNLENLNGNGKVFLGETELCRAIYYLRISQEFIVIDNSKEELPGLKKISGTLHVLEGDKDLLGKNDLVLHLSDGRKWNFIAFKGDPITAIYECQNGSGQGIV
ncbi:MAG: hypothetical protein HZC38_06795 [Chloroflexi bacterium]|nr:hypothetical protein [Chloroflexota bacterium]